MCWKPLNTYLKLIETKFPIKNGRNIPQLNIAMASAILNPGHDKNAKPEAAPTTLYQVWSYMQLFKMPLFICLDILVRYYDYL